MNIKHIHSENAEFQIIESLKTNRHKRKKLGEVFVEGIESIKQASSAGVTFSRIICEEIEKLSDWGRSFIAQHDEAVIIEMYADLYKKLCDREEPSELLATLSLEPRTLPDLLKDNALPDDPFILVCDRPSDHGNLGSIIRSANAFSVDAILICGHGVDPYDPKVIRSSLGSIFFTPIVHVESMTALGDFISAMRKRGEFSLVGTDSQGEETLGEKALAPPLMLILGNEARGISLKLRELCDRMVRIPLLGRVNSLNIASAASILMWEVATSSRSAKPGFLQNH